MKALEKSITRRSRIEEQLLGMRKEFDDKLTTVLTAIYESNFGIQVEQL